MLFDLMRKRYLLDHAMFAESDNFEGEVTMDENPFIEEGASAEVAEGEAEDDDVNVES